MNTLPIINAQSLWDQWRALKKSLADTEAMLGALGEVIPEVSPASVGRNRGGVGGEPSTTYLVGKAIMELAEISTPSVLEYVKKHTSREIDPNFISNLLSKKAKAELIEDIGRVEGSKARKYKRIKGALGEPLGNGHQFPQLQEFEAPRVEIPD